MHGVNTARGRARRDGTLVILLPHIRGRFRKTRPADTLIRQLSIGRGVSRARGQRYEKTRWRLRITVPPAASRAGGARPPPAPISRKAAAGRSVNDTSILPQPLLCAAARGAGAGAGRGSCRRIPAGYLLKSPGGGGALLTPELVARTNGAANHY
ncbi:hypothetical protein EVAR_61112_1 [Eumeta japonica]|uniref:Uncharacterized protein n=1 Tax=Eumeta variegata TaxID=151549 RepID=A0A4C1YPP6_EUMVA|nr:hypothetical protein EVAR_61112_1 [Eumeta japonica]